MPDQLPSAILNSTNSFDSLFALELDTKQRFDNILSNQQKPIDYPIPDFDKEMYPNGLPQSDLLDPLKTKGTLGEAMFSPDIRVAQYATDKIRSLQSNLPTSMGAGVPDRFAYDKMMNKFLNSDLGYNPYKSIEDNEDFNYRYDYQNKTMAGKLLSTVGHGISRFVAGVALKLGQTVGYMGSMVGEGIQELIEVGGGPKNNFMADVADNSLSRWFEQQEQNMKDSRMLAVFKPKGWEDKGFFNKLGYGAFWSDEVADGAAFMGEMIASMYLLGGLGKIGVIGRFGDTAIDMTSFLSKYGKFAQGTGKGIDFLTKLSTGARDISGIGRWAFSVNSEAAFEAAEGYKRSIEELKAERHAGYNNLTDEEIKTVAGDRAAARFKANLLILSASNAFENKMIFSPFFKKGALAQASGGQRGKTLGKLIGVSDDTSSLEKLAQASRREYNYSTRVGKFLDWKNSNSRLRFYGSRGLTATAMEGFWEENAQLAAERLSSIDNLSTGAFLNKFGVQTLEALKGFLPFTKSTDPEAETSIGLGAIIGVGGVSVGAKVQKGYKQVTDKDGNIVNKPIYLRGERRNLEEEVQMAVNTYEEYRRKFLNLNDIYITDPNTEKPIMDSDGNMQIDELKAMAVIEGMNKFASKQAAIEKIYDPLLRKNIQDDAALDFVMAAKSAGIFGRSLTKFENIENLDGEQLKKLGFDPSTIVDTSWLKQSIRDAGNIYDQVYNGPQPIMRKGDTRADNENRKWNLYKAKGKAHSAKKIAEEYRKAMAETGYVSAYSPEAADSDTVLQEYNTRVYQKRGHNQMSGLYSENGDFYKDYIKQQNDSIDKDLDEFLRILGPKIISGELAPTHEGFLMSKARWEKLFNKTYNFTVPEASMDLLLNEELGLREAKTGLRKEGAMKSTRYLTLEDLGDFESQLNNLFSEKARAKAAIKLDMEHSSLAKYGQMRNKASQEEYLASKLEDISEGMKNWKAFKEYTDSIQKKDGEAEDLDFEEIPPKAAPTSPETNVPTGQPTAPQLGTSPQTGQEPTKAPPPPVKKTIDSAALITKLNASVSSIIADELAQEETDYSQLAQDIEENWKDAKDIILSFFQTEVVDVYIAPIKAKIDSNTLTSTEENTELITQFDAASNMVNGLANTSVPEELITFLDSHFGPMATTLDNYEFPEEPPKPEQKGNYFPFESKEEAIADIERRRQAEKKALDEASGNIIPLNGPEMQAIDAKYDAELAELEGPVEKKEEKTELTDTETKIKTGLTKANFASTDEQVKEIAEKAIKRDGKISVAGIQKILKVNNSRAKVIAAAIDEELSGPPAPPPAPPVEPPPPPPPKKVVENSDSAEAESENYLDIIVDEAKKAGIFAFVQVFPEMIVTDTKGNPVIKDGVLQMKTAQQEQALRLHRVLEKMGNKVQPVNFWSEDSNGKPLFRMKLLLGGEANKGKYEKWIYRPEIGKTDKNGKPYPFPFIIAVITDQEGNPVYFNLQGEITDMASGQPVALAFSAREYTVDNLGTSRRGVLTGSRESLNGIPKYLTDNPLGEMNELVKRGVPVFASIDDVTSGKLSSYNVTNAASVNLRASYELRSVKQLRDEKIITNDAVVILKEGDVWEYSTDIGGTQKQIIRVGQPYLFDDRTGYGIPLRTRTLREMVYNGKPFLQGALKDVIESFSKGEVDPTTGNTIHVMELDENASVEAENQFKALHTLLRTLFYSQDVFISLNPEGNRITYIDNRPEAIPLLDTPINYSTNVVALLNPFTGEEILYDDLMAENLLSGAIPAEIEKGKKEFAKINKRVIFTLDMTHQQMMDTLGATPVKKTVKVQPVDMKNFVGKTYSKKGAKTTVTVVGFENGVFTIRGETGKETTQTQETFMKSLTKLEEVKLPPASEEVNQEFTEKIKLSKDKIKDLSEKSKTSTEDEFKDDDFGC